ncbi:MAG: 4Fe-4S dicluster domain-containing protein [Halolamina sp.]
MKVGAFVCDCGAPDAIDAEGVREGVADDDVEVVASASHLCGGGLEKAAAVVDEYDLDHVVATAPDAGCQKRIRQMAEAQELHADATAFVDHREGSGWVHDTPAATEKTARTIDATVAGLREESPSRSVSKEAGEHVVVVGDAAAAELLSGRADVTLLANGREFGDPDLDLDEVAVERGRVRSIDGSFGEFELTVEARVTDDCIGCMECVKRGPDEGVTSFPVDIAPDAPDGDYLDCCPVDAIEPEGDQRTIEADQVVYPGGPTKARGGLLGYFTHFDGGVAAAVESQLGGISKPQHLDIEMDLCASGDSGVQGCTRCTDACPHEAVTRPRVDEVAFDETACMDCGACTSACPTGAVELREPTNERLAREVESLLDIDQGGRLSNFFGGDTGIDSPVIAFTCSERAADALQSYGRRAGRGEDVSYDPILPVRVNCTDTVGEAQVLHALAAGADGVAIVGCGDSCLHSGPDPKAKLVDRMNVVTNDLELGARTAFFAPDGDDPAGFAEQLDAFVSDLDSSPIPLGEHEATGTGRPDSPRERFSTHDWALESLRVIIDVTDPERDVIRGLDTFGRMQVSDACNLTPTCSTLCPTDALQRTNDGALEFNHADCVNCGICENGCPEGAITMEPGLDRSRLPENRDGEEWEPVFEGEMIECVRCGTPFTSRGSMEKVRDEVGVLVEGVAGDTEHNIFEYCDECRAQIVFQG